MPQSGCLEEDLRGDLGRAALLQQAYRLVQVGVGPRDLLGELGLVATLARAAPAATRRPPRARLVACAAWSESHPECSPWSGGPASGARLPSPDGRAAHRRGGRAGRAARRPSRPCSRCAPPQGRCGSPARCGATRGSRGWCWTRPGEPLEAPGEIRSAAETIAICETAEESSALLAAAEADAAAAARAGSWRATRDGRRGACARCARRSRRCSPPRPACASPSPATSTGWPSPPRSSATASTT